MDSTLTAQAAQVISRTGNVSLLSLPLLRVALVSITADIFTGIYDYLTKEQFFISFG